MMKKKPSARTMPVNQRAKPAKPVAKPAPRPAVTPREFDDTGAVDALMAGIDKALRPLVQQIRQVIMKVDKGITEGVKWNSPSFYRDGWFATVNVRGKAGVMVVLHHGAKARPGAFTAASMKDETGMLHWHGTDRASVAFANEAEFEGKRKAFEKVMKDWLNARS